VIEDADIPLETVRRFIDAISVNFGARPKVRSSVVDLGLRIIGMNPNTYATTTGSDVTAPAPWGTVELVALGWGPWSQISVFTHEVVHVEQSREHGFVKHGWEYLTSPVRRVERECQAMAPQMELEMWRRGYVADWWPRVRAEALRAYLVKEEDLLVAEKYLRSLAPTVRAGGFISPVGRFAIQWLDDNAPELRGPNVRAR
jgi:hypothetical protein